LRTGSPYALGNCQARQFQNKLRLGFMLKLA